MMYKESTCPECLATLVWFKTKNGNLMPVDIKTLDKITYSKIKRGQTVMFDLKIHRSHYMDCPEARKELK